MSAQLNPVLPWPVLAVVAVLIIGAQVVTLRRRRAAGRDRMALWRWLGVTAAAVLLLLSATGTVIVTGEQDATRTAGGSDPSVFLLIDRSPEMAARDLGGRPRMDVAREDLTALTQRYPDARFAVIEFASVPTLAWPLSADTWGLRPVLDVLAPYNYRPDAATQTNAGAANTVLRYQLISAVQQYPNAPNLVYYLGAGAPESAVPAREFNLPPESVDGGAVLGYGTSAGAATLRAIADQIGVPYVPRSDPAPLAEVLPDGENPASTPDPVAAVGDQIETYWLPAAGAAVLILIELYFVLRDLRRSRLAGVRVES